MTQSLSRSDDVRTLLSARAVELARAAGNDDAVDHFEMLVVRVSERQVGIPIEHLREVRTPGHLTRVPSSNGVLLGLLGGPGGAVAAASLAQLLGLMTELPPDEQWVAVLEDTKAPLGLLVDNAEGVMSVASADLSRQPECGGLVMARTHDGTLVLDPAAALSDTRGFFTPARPSKGLPWDDA